MVFSNAKKKFSFLNLNLVKKDYCIMYPTQEIYKTKTTNTITTTITTKISTSPKNIHTGLRERE